MYYRGTYRSVSTEDDSDSRFQSIFNPLPIRFKSVTNPLPILCQSNANPVSIHAKPRPSFQCKSYANAVPIWCHFNANPMHSSPNQVSISCQSKTNPSKYHANPVQIQSDANLMPIHYESANKMAVLGQSVNDSPIRQNKVNQSPNVNTRPISQSLIPGPIHCKSPRSNATYRSTKFTFLTSEPIVKTGSTQDWQCIGTHWLNIMPIGGHFRK